TALLPQIFYHGLPEQGDRTQTSGSAGRQEDRDRSQCLHPACTGGKTRQETAGKSSRKGGKEQGRSYPDDAEARRGRCNCGTVSRGGRPRTQGKGRCLREEGGGS